VHVRFLCARARAHCVWDKNHKKKEKNQPATNCASLGDVYSQSQVGNLAVTLFIFVLPKCQLTKNHHEQSVKYGVGGEQNQTLLLRRMLRGFKSRITRPRE